METKLRKQTPNYLHLYKIVPSVNYLRNNVKLNAHAHSTQYCSQWIICK